MGPLSYLYTVRQVIREIVPWKNAREYFFWRVRRRLAQDALVKKLKVRAAGAGGMTLRPGKLDNALFMILTQWSTRPKHARAADIRS